MATTPAGTPYVESTDLVANYPGVSLALANHIDTLGIVLQVVSVTKLDAYTTTAASFTDVTGMTLNITPANTSSKILILSKITLNPRGDAMGSIQLLRGATIIGGGTAAGNRVSAMSGFKGGVSEGTGDLVTNFLDSPASISSQTYKIQARVTGGTLGINTTVSDIDSSTLVRTSSTITLMEIGA